jgi:hypothetical protein
MTVNVFFLMAFVALASSWSCQMPKDQVLVINVEMTPASFGVSCDNRQTWKPATLEPQGRQRYQCNLPGGNMWVRLNTDLPGEVHQESELQLKHGQRYEVYFDTAAHKWSVRPAIGGSAANE